MARLRRGGGLHRERNPMTADTKIIDGIRYYLCSGEWLPSVTSVLKATNPHAPALARWQRTAGAKGRTSSQQARDRGTTIHGFCERRLRGYRAARAIYGPIGRACSPC